jgi:hypothetical protein
MLPMFFNFLVPMAFSILRSYMNSPSSKLDDVILDGVKDACDYLSNKDNNTIDHFTNQEIQSQSMKGN